MTASPRFNEFDQFKLAPRSLSDEELLRKAIDCSEAAEHEKELFTKWLDELESGERRVLSRRQKTWANDVIDRDEPRAENLVSRGLVPTGRPVETPEVLRNLPLKPPGRK
jgi:hypothetical protein